MVALISRSPRTLTVFNPMAFFDEVDELSRSTWDSSRLLSISMMPRLDMYEDKDNFIIKADLPGVSKDNLDISIEGDLLTIKAERKQEDVSEDSKYYYCERSFGEYSRSVSLPYPVDFEKVSATLKDGILEISLPKTEEARSKHIEVKVQSS